MWGALCCEKKKKALAIDGRAILLGRVVFSVTIK
jgi:hypothetical protein